MHFSSIPKFTKSCRIHNSFEKLKWSYLALTKYFSMWTLIQAILLRTEMGTGLSKVCFRALFKEEYIKDPDPMIIWAFPLKFRFHILLMMSLMSSMIAWIKTMMNHFNLLQIIFIPILVIVDTVSGIMTRNQVSSVLKSCVMIKCHDQTIMTFICVMICHSTYYFEMWEGKNLKMKVQHTCSDKPAALFG